MEWNSIHATDRSETRNGTLRYRDQDVESRVGGERAVGTISLTNENEVIRLWKTQRVFSQLFEFHFGNEQFTVSVIGKSMFSFVKIGRRLGPISLSRKTGIMYFENVDFLGFLDLAELSSFEKTRISRLQFEHLRFQF